MMRIVGIAILTGLSLAACAKQTAAPKPLDRAALVERGRYLVSIGDCGGCHTPGALKGQRDAGRELAGADAGFEAGPTSVVYPPNLTPHPTTGLGKWSEGDIVKALRTGERPDGRILSPIMPWKSLAKLTDEDAAAMAAYLKSLTPIEHAVPGPASPATSTLPYHALHPAAVTATTSRTPARPAV